MLISLTVQTHLNTLSGSLLPLGEVEHSWLLHVSHTCKDIHSSAYILF